MMLLWPKTKSHEERNLATVCDHVTSSIPRMKEAHLSWFRLLHQKYLRPGGSESTDTHFSQLCRLSGIEASSWSAAWLTDGCLLTTSSRGSVTERRGVRLLAVPKPISRPGWWKGKLALFQMPATERGRADISPKSTPPQTGRGGELHRLRRGLHEETAHWVLTVIFTLAVRGLTCVILIALGTVNF